MKKLLIGLVAIVVLLVAALFVVPPLVPAEIYKEQIATQVREATGRTLDIKGAMSFSLLPNVAIEAADVTFANAPGAASPHMVALKRLVVKLKVFPLISGRVEVDSFVLVDPVINLEVDGRGRPNWLFAAPGSAGKTTGSGAGGAPGEAAGGAGGADGNVGVSDIRLGDVRVSNGTIGYSDARSGQKETISKVNLKLTLASFTSPFDAEGGLVWHGKSINLTARAGSPADLLAGKATKVELGVDSTMVTLAFDGHVTNAKRFQAAGAVKLDVPSVRALADWAGSPIEMEGTGLGPLKIDGQLALQGAAVSFSNATIALDEIKARGGFTFTDAKIPHIKAHLDVERLDLNPYLASSAKQGDAGGAPAGGRQAGAKKAAPAVAEGWNSEPIDASALKSMNADLTLTTQALIFQKIRIDKSALRVTLKGGRLVLDLNQLALYQGTGKARIVVDASGPVLGIENDLELAGIQAEPFLRDAAGIDRLLGESNARIHVKGSGRSEMEIVKSLAGDGAVKFTDGALKGYNIASLVRSLSVEALTKGVGGEQKTDFSELSGTFVIKRGILDNRDMLMKSPLLRISGAGTSDLPKRFVNYRVEPKVVGSLKGQGGAAGAQGIVIPVVFKGPWDDVKVIPELFSPRQLSPEGIAGAVKSIKKGGGIKNILKRLTGQGAGAPAEQQPAPAERQPAERQPQQLIDPKDPIGTLKKLFPGFK